MATKKGIGRLLREKRKELKLTTEELAKRASIDRTYITKIEKHDKLPSPLVFKKIIDVLNDQELFEAYLKIKYPSLYEQFRKEEHDLNIETNKIADEVAAQKNKTPEGEAEFVRLMRNVIIRTRKSIAKFKKILVRLENIKGEYLKSKKAIHNKDKVKD